MTASQFMLLFAGIASPWLVALLRKHNWSSDLVVLVAGLVSLLCFLAGQLMDGALTWPPSQEFWLGLAAAFGLQQSGYYVTKKVAPAALLWVERR